MAPVLLQREASWELAFSQTNRKAEAGRGGVNIEASWGPWS